MNIDLETKFELGEKVFFVWLEDSVEEGIIQSANLSGNIKNEPDVYYIIEGTFHFGTIVYYTATIESSKVFGTREEAKEKLRSINKAKLLNIFSYVKRNAKEIVKKFKVSDFEEEDLKEIIRNMKWIVGYKRIKNCKSCKKGKGI